MGLSAWGLEPVRPGRLRLRGALSLYRRRLRRGRWIQDLLAVLGIAAGVALLYATQVASTSLSGPVSRLNQGIVGGGQLEVMARGGSTVDERLYRRIVALPGVRRAAPILQVPGNLVGPKGDSAVTFFGADPRIVELRGSLLRGFSSSDAAQQESVVVPEPAARHIGLRFGDDVRLQLNGRTVRVPAAVAGRQQIAGLADTSIALVPLRYLQRLAGTGPRVSRILVEAEPGKVGQVTGEMRRMGVAGADVRSSTHDTELFDKAALPTSAASTIFAALSALVGWLFAVCALLVTASERRKLVTQQRRQGFPPSATLTTLLVDAAVIGTVGVLLGLAAGEVLSRDGFRSNVSFLSGAFPIGDVRIVTWQSVAVAAVGGLAAALIGVLAPVRGLVVAALPGGSRRADQPVDERPGGGFVPATTALGVVALCVSVGITLWAPSQAILGLVLLGAAAACLLPLALGAAIEGLERLNRAERPHRSSAALELALHQLRARRWRARGLAIATTGAIAVFGATALQGARLNLQHGLDDVARTLNGVTDVWVTARGAGSSIATTSFAPRDAQRLEQLPSVAHVGLYRSSLLDVAGRRVWVMVPSPGDREMVPPGQVLKGSADSLYRRLGEGGWATLSRGVADDLGVGLNDRVTLPTPRPITVRVAAISTNLGWSSGAIAINTDDFRRAWNGSDAIAAYHIAARPGTSPATVRADVTRALGPRSGLAVETAPQRAARQKGIAEAGLSRLRQITVLTILAAVLAMGAAMTGLLWQHRPTIASHKFLGMSTGLLWRSLLAETGVLFGVGVLTGAAFGLFGQVLCTRGVERITGFPIIQDLQLATAGITAAIVLGASLLAVILPGYVVARSLPSSRE